MPQILLLTVKSYELDGGTETGNEGGLMIRVTAEQGGSAENIQMYFYGPDEYIPEFIGYRNEFNGALVLILQRRDFANYALLLDQAKAAYIRVVLKDNDEISAFHLSTARFPAEDQRRKFSETDAAEFKKRTTKS